jgi:hypothetical protein
VQSHTCVPPRSQSDDSALPSIVSCSRERHRRLANRKLLAKCRHRHTLKEHLSNLFEKHSIRNICCFEGPGEIQQSHTVTTPPRGCQRRIPKPENRHPFSKRPEALTSYSPTSNHMMDRIDLTEECIDYTTRTGVDPRYYFPNDQFFEEPQTYCSSLSMESSPTFTSPDMFVSDHIQQHVIANISMSTNGYPPTQFTENTMSPPPLQDNSFDSPHSTAMPGVARQPSGSFNGQYWQTVPHNTFPSSDGTSGSQGTLPFFIAP